MIARGKDGITMNSSNEPTVISPTVTRTDSGSPLYQSALFLLGSFIIALLISSAVHELGHGLIHELQTI